MIAEATLTFPDRGVVMVLGSNLSGRGKFTSVGSGKTSLGEAITRTLLGIDGRDAELSHFSLDEKGNTYVKVTAELNGQPLVVESGYKCDELSRTGEGLRFTVGNNAPIERAHVRDTREELARTIGVSAMVADWTVFLDGERLKFNKLSQAAALDLLMQSLDQPPWSVYHERARRREATKAAKVNTDTALLAAANQELVAARASVEEATADLNSAEAAWLKTHAAYEEKARKHAADAEVAATHVRNLKAAVAKLRQDIAAVTRPNSQDIVDRLAAHRADLEVSEKHRSGWMVHVDKRQAAVREAKLHLDKLRATPKNCPTCEKPWDKTVTQDDLDKAAAAVKSTQAKLDEAREQVQLCNQDIQASEAAIKAIKDEQDDYVMRQTAPLREKLEKTQDDLEHQLGVVAELERRKPLAPQDPRESQKAVLASAKVRLTQAETRLAAATTTLAESKRDQLLAQYWTSAFSTAGLPNVALRSIIGPLNEAARTVSTTMTGGIIEVNFEAAAELASGALKPKLVTRVKNAYGAGRLTMNSKGENGIVNLVIAETQAEIGRISRKVGFRWFDEAVNSQDPVVRRNVYQYLRQQAAERDILVFVVDHHAEAVNYADHILVAEKSPDGFTTFRWN